MPNKFNLPYLFLPILMAVAVGYPSAQLSTLISSDIDLVPSESQNHASNSVLRRHARQIGINYGSDFNFGASYFDRAQQIDNIFQIPIQTLTAINNVVRNTRPISQRRRQILQNITTNVNYRPGSFQSSGFSNFRFLTDRAKVADLRVQEDGSSYKI